MPGVEGALPSPQELQDVRRKALAKLADLPPGAPPVSRTCTVYEYSSTGHDFCPLPLVNL